MSGEFSRDNMPAVDANAAEETTPAVSTPVKPPAAEKDATPLGVPKSVEDVMSSDIGINTLLARLKQSIASARDFSAFLKKRSALEEEQAQGLKRLAKTQSDTIKRSEARGQSYAAQLVEVMRCHDRMGDNGIQFALSLHQMHEDLNELSANMERGRKQWKHEGLDAEKRASDAEAAMQKAKSRYDSLAEDYDRARTGDTKGSRRLGLKGPKSAEQYESDLLRKVQQADADYEEKVKQAQMQRESLLREGRPKAIKALRELCAECDSGLTLQLQKFAAFNEKLLLGNGVTVYPLGDANAPAQQRSMRDVVASIDNYYDFNSFVSSHRAPPRPSEIKYEKHPTLAPKTQQPRAPEPSPFTSGPALSVNTGGPPSQPGSMNSRFAGPPAPGPVLAASQPQAYTDSPVGYGHPQPSQIQASQPENAPHSALPSTTSRDGPSLPYPTYQNERSASLPQQQQPNPHQQTTGSVPYTPPTASPASRGYAGAPTSTQKPASASIRPMFGVTLDALFERDGTAVPVVVNQCITAVEHFGLDTEGIYRQSGTASNVSALREQFNNDPNGIDFRNPTNFFHDVNAVATLLKQFFRDLPDPLFTRASYDNFIEAAKIEDDTARRDALHQNINDLPDPNYATLRSLVLHLHRVMQRESRNRMGSSNLALCFAPTVMGQHTNAQIADASLQARVLDTILINATAIFDED